MPFGLNNSPSILRHEINNILVVIQMKNVLSRHLSFMNICLDQRKFSNVYIKPIWQFSRTSESSFAKKNLTTMMKGLCKIFDNKLSYFSVGHPQSNGSLERFYSTLLDGIRILMLENPYEHSFNILTYKVIAYNNPVIKSYVFAPYKVVLGKTSSRPSRNVIQSPKYLNTQEIWVITSRTESYDKKRNYRSKKWRTCFRYATYFT